MKTSIIIPNWDGRELLEKNLPKVLEVGASEVIVIDDASRDSSREVIKKFKSIKLIENDTNLGFAKSVNRGVENASGDVVILLNSDVSPKKNVLEFLLPHFKNQETFAVSCNEPKFSWATARFNGFLKHSSGPKTDKTHISFWASGGSAAFSKEKWDLLRGMDSIFHPFYWEDIDLSYRAWKRGWKIFWEPGAVVHHEHGTTIKRFFSESYRQYISDRNHLIFLWKNITSSNLFLIHQRKLTSQILTGRFWRPFVGALAMLPKILEKRRIEKKEKKVRDEEIFKLFE